MAVHKKHEEEKAPSFGKASEGKETKSEETKAASAEGSGGPKTEPVVVSDIVIETAERIETVEQIAPEKDKPAQTKTSGESAPIRDPLIEFKEKMNEEEQNPSSSSARKNYMWPILFIFVIAILLLAGAFLYKQGVILNKDEVNVVTLSPSPTITPEPTQTLDLTKYEIEILNGSGVAGEASRQQTSLESEGFTVSSVGNADSSDYTDTIIQAKKEVDKAFLDKLKSILANTFTIGETETLSDDALTPVIVIIGTEK